VLDRFDDNNSSIGDAPLKVGSTHSAAEERLMKTGRATPNSCSSEPQLDHRKNEKTVDTRQHTIPAESDWLTILEEKYIQYCSNLQGEVPIDTFNCGLEPRPLEEMHEYFSCWYSPFQKCS
jgi:hypothetical protein